MSAEAETQPGFNRCVWHSEQIRDHEKRIRTVERAIYRLGALVFAAGILGSALSKYVLP